MYETPDGRQPPWEAGPPWDAWVSPPPAAHLPAPEYGPPADYGPPGERPRGAQHRLAQGRPGERSRWHWLLLAAVVIPLLTPLYNRVSPRLLGVPFFYWCQLAFVGLAAAVTIVIHLATKRRGS